jgi:hypothetical protein
MQSVLCIQFPFDLNGSPHLFLVCRNQRRSIAVGPAHDVLVLPCSLATGRRFEAGIKRSLARGFAGIPNPLFAADNTLMLFGDGK